ncbi:PKD domain-containing protein [Herbiconiux sp. SYSU D00978]|uniref:PKD domain-containing protein n=1 Tax=Herbiconiux sp. SYSU D00978 TaxID=2812562 RepID=UPI001A978C35|nr:hypothetical protein [Herbiconiux sp. SYSU D00978]
MGEQRMEPDGWAVTGLDANFLGDGQARVVAGQLLGQPASVRFEPVGWTWDYGDGSSRTSASPGSTWQQLGLDEFEPTPTSHVFDEPGTHTVTLTVSYSAAYSFGGGGWVAVSGAVTAAADPITVVVGNADTVLVEHPCTVDAAAPGC